MLGGVDVKDTVWRIMKQAIKNDLAKTVNWRGVNGKTSFQSLELKSVVIGKCFCRKSSWTLKVSSSRWIECSGISGFSIYYDFSVLTLCVCAALLEAVRRNPTCAQITELEVEKAIIRWFHLAGDREGGRKKRAPLQDVSVENWCEVNLYKERKYLQYINLFIYICVVLNFDYTYLHVCKYILYFICPS